jgi:dihydrofolate reductase
VPPEDPALKARKLDWLGEAGLHLMGRATYEEMAAFWPTSDDEYAKPMNDIPKIVFSKTLTKADWPQSTIADGDVADEVSSLKREPGKDMIAWGGAAFAQSLSRLRLIDEYRLVLQPVALGDGSRCSRASPRRSCWTSSRPGHTPTARCSMSTAPLPGEPIITSADPSESTTAAIIAVSSVSTGNEMRDNHLRSADSSKPNAIR